MTDVVAFVLARLAEDEHFALRAGGKEWSWGASEFIPNFDPEFFKGVFATNPPPDEGIAMSPEGPGDFSWTESRGAHIARHDPARVLAEVAALRAVVEFHESWPVLVETEPEFPGLMPGTTGTTDLGATTISIAKRIAWLTEREYRERFGVAPPTAPMLRALAGIWSDHPDYDPAWA